MRREIKRGLKGEGQRHLYRGSEKRNKEGIKGRRAETFTQRE